MPYVACLRGLCGEHRTRYLHRLPPDNIARRLLTASTRDGGCCGSRGLALGSPQLGDGAAGVSPVGQRCRRAHTGPVHPRAPQGTPGHPSTAAALVPPAPRWDFCTLVLPLLVLSPALSAPHPHRTAQHRHQHRQALGPAAPQSTSPSKATTRGYGEDYTNCTVLQGSLY